MLQDTFRRVVNYMRISVTDRCNLRCVYCMPEEGLPWIPRGNVLSYEEITQIVAAAASIGVSRIRVTGGEPLVRRDLDHLVAMIGAIPGVEDISLSTNGILLAESAAALKAAGLRRVNVSLDTLHRDRFINIAKRDHLDAVLRGLEAAEALELKPIKLNMVVMRGVNDDELEDFARLTLEHDWHIRFIEVMPVEENLGLGTDAFISADEILGRLHGLGELTPSPGPDGNGPARYFRFPRGVGSVGVISPLSHNYCERCNRVRLTADGKLRLCLFGDNEIDLRSPLRAGGTPEDIAEIFQEAMLIKPRRHHLELGKATSMLRALSQIGG